MPGADFKMKKAKKKSNCSVLTEHLKGSQKATHEVALQKVYCGKFAGFQVQRMQRIAEHCNEYDVRKGVMMCRTCAMLCTY
jgi:hypothetical protein